MPRRLPKPDPIEDGRELGNTSRNERQKSVLLCEVGKIHRDSLSRLVDCSKEIVEKSKKLCLRPVTKFKAPYKHAG